MATSTKTEPLLAPDLQRRKQMAEAFMAQWLQAPQAQMVSGHYVAPSWTQHLNQALQGYRRLNALAIHKIRPGGLLFTFSCSQVVSRDDFRRSVFVAAANTGRNVRIFHQTGQPADHPVNIYHPESEYLKGLILYIE